MCHRRNVLLGGCILAASLMLATSAFAQTGVSDDRVSLPEGPGSLEGVGDNTTISPSMGTMTHSVAINVPPGFGAVTPELSLSYSSGGGSGLVGMGWSISLPTVERMTYRGLPEYGLDDDFSASGGAQLVRLPGTNPPVYRARYEKGFIRYTWMEAGSGDEGYWIAEYPDGSKAYFGATADGTLVPGARMGDAEGTAVYNLTEKVDVYGHSIRWTYQKFGFYNLPVHVGYVFVNDNPTYEVTFEYEERSDEGGLDLLSDASFGFNAVLDQRMTGINILSRGVTVTRYAMNYLPLDQSGGISLLGRVSRQGVRGTTYPIQFEFEYSQSLGGDGNSPRMMDMGQVEASFGARTSQLIDINGDALPDIIDATQNGAHRFFLNIAQEDGTGVFDATPRLSNVGTRSSHNLTQPTVQVLDVNGDGFTDLINAATGQTLINKGNGDWDQDASVEGTSALADALSEDFDAEEGDLQSLRFMDINNDRRIDLIRATAFETSFFMNGGDDGFETVDSLVSLEAGFEENNLQLSDMNGDGLLDVVQLQLGSLRYRLNYGRGMWGDWVNISGLSLSQAEVELAELEDINGDALADIVIVQGTSVSFALNDNSSSFDDLIQLESADVEGEIPLRDATTTVLFADMNGNGSSDVVWIQANGKVDALELFPLRPNLMTRITNGIGMVTDITYETAAQQMARDGGWEAWNYKIPFPMNVVRRLDKYDLLTDLHEITEFVYKDGFYDGNEKQFRGFERVEMVTLGDETVEEGRVVQTYDVGAQDPYFHGLLLRAEASSGGRVLTTNETTYDDCEVAEVPDGTEFPVRFICPVAMRGVSMEGAAQSEWITVESAYAYDGYGNVTRSNNQGVTSVGGGSCEPCGDRDAEDFGRPCGSQCLGDETFTETEFVPTSQTDGLWLISAPFRIRTYGREGSALVSERNVYYDGNDFEGLPLGFLTRGDTTRVTHKRDIDSDDVIASTRRAYDDDGNVVAALDPLGTAQGQTHRREYVYDEEGLRVERAELLLEDAEGSPYRLRREVVYEDLFDNAVEVTAWMRVVNDQVVSTRRAWTMSYDEFGRVTERYQPGNTTAAPNETFEYDLQSPASRIITRQRSEVNGDFDLETILCVDGRGRAFQSRSRLAQNRYQVSGLTRYNLRSNGVEIFQPYVDEGPDADQCDTSAPQGVLATTSRYDAAGRILEVTVPDAGIYGTASVRRTAYEPLATLSYDAEDNDPESVHFDTPTVTHINGLGLATHIERQLNADDVATYSLIYDSLGRIHKSMDPEGNVKTQTQDLVGRIVRREDPNTAAEATFEYDDASNLVRFTDARGVVIAAEFDGLNRMTAQYDAADREGTLIEYKRDFDPDCDELLCTNAEGVVTSVSYPGPDGQRAFEYTGLDLRGRPVIKRRVIAGLSLDTELRYDDANRLKEVVYPDGQVISRSHDDGSRLVGIDGLLEDITYDERGLRTGVTYGDGTQTTRDYDALFRPSERRVTGQGGEVLQGFAYEFDRVGNVLSIDDLADASPAHPNFDARYTYDAWYRNRTIEMEVAGQDETLTFDFDMLDNMVQRGSSQGQGSAAPVGSLSYDSYAPNAVTEFNGVLFDYDEAGHTTTRGDQTLDWDFKGRLKSVEAGGETLATYTCGSQFDRVVKQEGDQTTLYGDFDFEVRDGISTLYVRLGRARVARLESDSLATTVFSDRVDDGQINSADALAAAEAGEESGPLLWSSVRRLLMETGPDDGTTYLHHDHLGSLTMATGLVDGEAQVLGERAFFLTGTERPDSWGYVDDYGFTGLEHDRATGLIRTQWRYLDPNTGRWLSIDPFFANAGAESFGMLGHSTTAYAYVGGNFGTATDPTGLYPPGQAGPAPKPRKPAGKTWKSSNKKNNKPKYSKRDKQRMKNTIKFLNSDSGDADLQENFTGAKYAANTPQFQQAAWQSLMAGFKQHRKYVKSKAAKKAPKQQVAPDPDADLPLDAPPKLPANLQADIARGVELRVSVDGIKNMGQTFSNEPPAPNFKASSKSNFKGDVKNFVDVQNEVENDIFEDMDKENTNNEDQSSPPPSSGGSQPPLLKTVSTEI